MEGWQQVALGNSGSQSRTGQGVRSGVRRGSPSMVLLKGRDGLRVGRATEEPRVSWGGAGPTLPQTLYGPCRRSGCTAAAGQLDCSPFYRAPKRQEKAFGAAHPGPGPPPPGPRGQRAAVWPAGPASARWRGERPHRDLQLQAADGPRGGQQPLTGWGTVEKWGLEDHGLRDPVILAPACQHPSRDGSVGSTGPLRLANSCPFLGVVW